MVENNPNHYFAYGSNLHPIRLESRLGQVDFFGKGKLKSTEIHFHKRGSDGSGKATIQSTSDQDKIAWGAVYELSKKQEKLLDKFESLGAGYHKTYVDVEMENGNIAPCFTYEGMTEYVDFNSLPFHWYKQLVIEGSRYLKFPENYIDFLENIPSEADPNDKRVSTNRRLIKLMKEKK
ncbi:MAG: gamma-glutamylcyclotransferase [Balneola sp.]|nr:gamma-glutamylcyclotransferase [Balneola sp.]|tara:strand:+ start:10150 stop:10683 length:534 start_codon:yes stop_codon:yes gene_type:complete